MSHTTTMVDVVSVSAPNGTEIVAMPGLKRSLPLLVLDHLPATVLIG